MKSIDQLTLIWSPAASGKGATSAHASCHVDLDWLHEAVHIPNPSAVPDEATHSVLVAPEAPRVSRQIAQPTGVNDVTHASLLMRQHIEHRSMDA